LVYIPHNISYYFLNHLSIRLEKPYINIDREGNSVFSVYPLLLTLFLLIKKYKIKEMHPVIILSCLSVGTTIILLMTMMATGWSQFGSRYFFDVIPILFLLTLFAIRNIHIALLIILFIYGLAVNLLGIWSFYS